MSIACLFQDVKKVNTAQLLHLSQYTHDVSCLSDDEMIAKALLAPDADLYFTVKKIGANDN